MSDQCIKIKDNGENCHAPAVDGSGYCFFHKDPEKLREATRKGGKQGKRAVLPESNVSLKSEADIVSLLESTVNEVRIGQLDRAIGNTVGYLSAILLRAFEQGELLGRIEALENYVNEERQPK
jgi:hypothetical protein